VRALAAANQVRALAALVALAAADQVRALAALAAFAAANKARACCACKALAAADKMRDPAPSSSTDVRAPSGNLTLGGRACSTHKAHDLGCARTHKIHSLSGDVQGGTGSA
jgi:hypothetical protein